MKQILHSVCRAAMEGSQDGQSIKICLQNCGSGVSSLSAPVNSVMPHQQADTVLASQIQPFLVQPLQPNTDTDSGAQSVQQTHPVQTFQHPCTMGQKVQETPEVMTLLLEHDGGNTKDVFVVQQLNQSQPAAWSVEEQQNSSAPLVLNEHSDYALQPTCHDAAAMLSPALQSEVVKNTESASIPVHLTEVKLDSADHLDSHVGAQTCKVQTESSHQSPSCTRCTSQLPSCSDTITLTDSHVLQLWRTVGERKRLTTDVHIARYFNPKLEDRESQSDRRCVHCSSLLTENCLACLLSAQQPVYSHSPSPGTSVPYLSTHTVQGKHDTPQDPVVGENEMMQADNSITRNKGKDSGGHVSAAGAKVCENTLWENQVRKQCHVSKTAAIVHECCDSVSALMSNPSVSCKKNPKAAAVSRKRSSNDRRSRTVWKQTEPMSKQPRQLSADSSSEDCLTTEETEHTRHKTTDRECALVAGDRKGSFTAGDAERPKYPICDGVPYSDGNIPAYKHFSEYRCSRCDKTFQYKKSLRCHMGSPCDTAEEQAQFKRKDYTLLQKPQRSAKNQHIPSGIDPAADKIEESEVKTRTRKKSCSDRVSSVNKFAVKFKNKVEKQSQMKKRKRCIKEFEEEYTIEDFMTGRIQIPTVVSYRGRSRKRMFKAFSHYFCEQCSKVIVSLRAYKSHRKEHLKETRERPSKSQRTGMKQTVHDLESVQILTDIKDRLLHVCAFCSRIFINSMHHKMHVRTHTGENTCSFCRLTFTNRRLLRMHQTLIRVPERKRLCHYCDLQFLSRCQIKEHMQTHQPENKDHCQVCELTFESLGKEEIIQHLKTHKIFFSGSRTLCAVCGKNVNRQKIKVHMKSHTDHRPFTCHVCGKSFKLKATLKKHNVLHQEKAFQCETCGLYFRLMRDLSNHNAFTHMGQGFQCNECGKRFPTERKLERHILHSHRNVKPFVCSVCGLGHVCQRDLDLHMRIHTGEKPHQCPHCSSKFARLNYLKLHLRTHTGEKPYVCGDCGRRFSRRDTLVDHRKSRHKDRMFPCPICGDMFPLQSSVAFHRHKVHGGDYPAVTDHASPAAGADITHT